MTSETIKQSVENYHEILRKVKRMEKQLMRLRGRDPEQEMYLQNQIDSYHRVLDFIDRSLVNEDILRDKEAAVVDHRIAGESLSEIASFFCVTSEWVRRILELAYDKMATYR